MWQVRSPCPGALATDPPSLLTSLAGAGCHTRHAVRPRRALSSGCQCPQQPPRAVGSTPLSLSSLFSSISSSPSPFCCHDISRLPGRDQLLLLMHARVHTLTHIHRHIRRCMDTLHACLSLWSLCLLVCTIFLSSSLVISMAYVLITNICQAQRARTVDRNF